MIRLKNLVSVRQGALNSNQSYQVFLYFILGFILLYVRASDRILNPQVWQEDGKRNLVGYLRDGWESLLDPVNGYLIVIPKLITFFSASISLVHYPLISTILAWIFTSLVFVAVSTSAIFLRGGILLAISAMLIPSDPEVFGLPLYTFWWSGLILFLLIFWDPSRPWIWGRTIIIGLASLSSPLCIVTIPVFWLRAIWYRGYSVEIFIAIVATIFMCGQLFYMWPIQPGGHVDIYSLVRCIPKFFGSFLVGNIAPGYEWLAGLVLCSYLMINSAVSYKNRIMLGLLYLLGASIVMSITRVDVSNINQATAGPRYFFFPYIVIAWFCIYIYTNNKGLNKYCSVGFLLVMLSNSIPVLGRHHDDLDWGSHIASCPNFDSYRIPIQSNGDSGLAWWMELSGVQCSYHIGNKAIPYGQYPYKVINNSDNPAGMIAVDALIKNEFNTKDYQSMNSGLPSLPEGVIFGSYTQSDNSSAKEVIIEMTRGSSIYYRSDPRGQKQMIMIEGDNKRFTTRPPPSYEWVILEFSNKLLPEKFAVKFVDGGSGFGEWSAIATNIK